MPRPLRLTSSRLPRETGLLSCNVTVSCGYRLRVPLEQLTALNQINLCSHSEASQKPESQGARATRLYFQVRHRGGMLRKTLALATASNTYAGGFRSLVFKLISSIGDKCSVLVRYDRPAAM